MSGVEDRLRSVLDAAEPHMDGTYTVTLPKYADRPGQLRPLLPYLFIRDIFAAADEIVRLRGELAAQADELTRHQALVDELRRMARRPDIKHTVVALLRRHGFGVDA